MEEQHAAFRTRVANFVDYYEEAHPDSQCFCDLLMDLADLHAKKQADYGRDTDPFANVRGASQLGIRPSLGVFLRMNDKWNRIYSFALKGNLANESVEDSLQDIAVYALIGLVLLQNGE